MEAAEMHRAAAQLTPMLQLPIPVQGVQAHLAPLRKRQQLHAVAHHTAAPVKLTAAKAGLRTKAMVNTLAAITSNVSAAATGGGANQLRRLAFGRRPCQISAPAPIRPFQQILIFQVHCTPICGFFFARNQ
jgi:hypothetical protein